MNKRGAISVLQILILVTSIIAISYLIGSEVRVVSAEEKYDSFSKDKYPELDLTGSSLSSAVDPTKLFGGGARSKATTEIPHGYAGQAFDALGISTAPGTWGFSASGIVQGAGWAIVVYGVIKMVGGFLGWDKGTTDAVATAAAWGVFVGQAANTLLGSGGLLQTAGASISNALGGISIGALSFGIGIAVAIIVFVLTYKKVKQQIVEFTCYPWDAKTGGSNCELCNQQGALPCSEYQCRSLGQSCQLLNPGTSDEKCAWVNKNDVEPPIITTDTSVLSNGYKYSPDNTISPPDKGVKILNEKTKDGCIKAFTPLKFGITLDEPAKCKIDYTRKNSFDDMGFFFGGDSLFRYNHSQYLSLPGNDSLAAENLTIENGGHFELHTRCQDSNGNSNTATFVFKFCVEEGPDTTAPVIVSTNLLNGMPIAYNQTSLDLEVYVNEPSECRWDYLDKSFDDMENSMSCSSSVFEMNAQMLYTCKTKLTGIKSKEENKFYFRCKDKPLSTTDRNVNTESYVFKVVGTQPLVINSVGPNGTIKDSTEVVKVTLEAETSAGYKEGEATCFYSSTGEQKDYVMFYETLSHEHSQELHLPSGDYEYFIKCVDLGGNSDVKSTTFKVESGTSSPIVVRAYHDEGYLKLITNEEAKCVYDTVDCSYLFKDGTSITTNEETEHFATWNTKTNMYIKCQGKYGNEPLPNECSIIVRAYEY